MVIFHTFFYSHCFVRHCDQVVAAQDGGIEGIQLSMACPRGVCVREKCYCYIYLYWLHFDNNGFMVCKACFPGRQFVLFPYKFFKPDIFLMTIRNLIFKEPKDGNAWRSLSFNSHMYGTE